MVEVMVFRQKGKAGFRVVKSWCPTEIDDLHGDPQALSRHHLPTASPGPVNAVPLDDACLFRQ
jgi:hypothetical protein